MGGGAQSSVSGADVDDAATKRRGTDVVGAEAALLGRAQDALERAPEARVGGAHEERERHWAARWRRGVRTGREAQVEWDGLDRHSLTRTAESSTSMPSYDWAKNFSSLFHPGASRWGRGGQRRARRSGAREPAGRTLGHDLLCGAKREELKASARTLGTRVSARAHRRSRRASRATV